MADFLNFSAVSFAYPGMIAPLLAGVTGHCGEGWTGVVGPNGAGKTTLLKLGLGLLEPTDGTIQRTCGGVYVAQRTDEPPPNFADFMDNYESDAFAWRDRLGVADDWADRWDSLSHGERKRAQIAAALWSRPGILALDEPTNHLDAAGREKLLEVLKGFRGVGLVVSHDRTFLDALCSQCLFLTMPGATMRPGGVSDGEEQDRREQSMLRTKDDAARHEARRLRVAAQASHERAERLAANARVASRASKAVAHDSDARATRAYNALTNKNGWANAQSAALAKRASKAAGSRVGSALRKDYRLGFWLDSAGYSRRNNVARLPAGEIPLGDGRVLRHPELVICPRDRIALTGPNGIGKSTLVKALLGAVNVPPERLIDIPQEITAAGCADVLARVKALDEAVRGRILTCVSRLGSRPGHLVESAEPSPGEVRKLLLALGVDRGPHLVVMDEPTNHMDLPSIDCLKAALEACPCAMLLVSHDRAFLDGLVTISWALAAEPDGKTVLLVCSCATPPQVLNSLSSNEEV